MPREYLLESQW